MYRSRLGMHVALFRRGKLEHGVCKNILYNNFRKDIKEGLGLLHYNPWHIFAQVRFFLTCHVTAKTAHVVNDKLTVFLELRTRKIFCFSREIKSSRKYPFTYLQIYLPIKWCLFFS